MPGVRLGTIEVVVFRTAAAPEFLLLKRSESATPYPGIWQIVSGRIEDGEKAWEAALREVREETGLRPEKLYATPLTNVFYVSANDSANLSPFFAVEAAGQTAVTLSEEHTAFEWLGGERAASRLVWPGQKNAIQCVTDFILRNDLSRELLRIPFQP